tara:strand:- start:875 stop:1513 length:639 start_codon:yes stop_codon:yes gene_type:complete
VKNVTTNTDTQGLAGYTDAQLQAELVSRKSATQDTYADVYERAGCSGEKQRKQLDRFFDGVRRSVSITKMSTRGNGEFISGNVKNFARKLGNLSGVHEILGMTTPTHLPVVQAVVVDEPDALSVCRDYLRMRKDAGTGFTTKLFLEQVGTYEGKAFGVVVKDDKVGTRYIIGALRKKDAQAFKQTSPFYKSVDKATKGQRMKVDYLVFDPQG